LRFFDAIGTRLTGGGKADAANATADFYLPLARSDLMAGGRFGLKAN
jgi:hypothetical protein